MRSTYAHTLGRLAVLTLVALAGSFVVSADHDDTHFRPGNLVVSRSVYAGTPTIVSVGENLPPGCVPGTVAVPQIGGGTTPVTVTCATAVANGTYPTVFNGPPARVRFADTPMTMTSSSTDFNSFGSCNATRHAGAYYSPEDPAKSMADETWQQPLSASDLSDQRSVPSDA